MATMGRRKLNNDAGLHAAESSTPILPASLVVSTITVPTMAVTSGQPFLFGGPIMRDDFITRTGFMPPKLALMVGLELVS